MACSLTSIWFTVFSLTILFVALLSWSGVITHASPISTVEPVINDDDFNF
jgi:uncharacterized membrane protein